MIIFCYSFQWYALAFDFTDQDEDDLEYHLGEEDIAIDGIPYDEADRL